MIQCVCVLISAAFDLFVLCRVFFFFFFAVVPRYLILILTCRNKHFFCIGLLIVSGIFLFVFFFFFTSTCSPFVWGNTLKADFRLKCAPSLLPRSLLCYLLPIGLTLAHCSLASCQSWFLSPAPFIFLPFFLPFPPLLFSPLSPSLVESSRRFFRDLLPFHHISCFIRTVSFFLSFFPSRRFASLSICPFL